MNPATAANEPEPNSIAKPAPMRPPSSRLRIRLGRAAWAAAAVAPAAAGAATDGLTVPGWVIDFCIGAAVPGEVFVDGGAWNVFDPRLPELLPPPGRASANVNVRARPAVAATRAVANRVERRDRIKRDMLNL